MKIDNLPDNYRIELDGIDYREALGDVMLDIRREVIRDEARERATNSDTMLNKAGRQTATITLGFGAVYYAMWYFLTSVSRSEADKSVWVYIGPPASGAQAARYFMARMRPTGRDDKNRTITLKTID